MEGVSRRDAGVYASAHVWRLSAVRFLGAYSQTIIYGRTSSIAFVQILACRLLTPAARRATPTARVEVNSDNRHDWLVTATAGQLAVATEQPSGPFRPIGGFGMVRRSCVNNAKN